MSSSQNLLLRGDTQDDARAASAWGPPALRSRICILATVACWAFIAVLQYFLTKSLTQGGVIFSYDVSSLPLRQSFVYLYMPTIIAVIFSTFILWIDIDAKRFEPYYQLSKPNGALGKDSLLLRYTFDFMPLVPFFALRNRHWYVFWASTAALLTSFGIVPLQAAIFSKGTATQSYSQAFSISEKFIHSSLQKDATGIGFAQTAYGILNLNDTLQPFTTRDYALAPFHAPGLAEERNSTWTVNTTLYSMDLQCEEPRRYRGTKGPAGYNSSAGCTVETGTFGTEIVGTLSNNTPADLASVLGVKPFSSFFSIYHGDSYHSDQQPTLTNSVLEDSCPKTGDRTFFAAFVRNRAQPNDRANNVTAMFCKNMYYEQKVEATIDAITKIPKSVVEQEEKRSMSSEMFDGPTFERRIDTAQTVPVPRGDYLPSKRVPTYLERFRDMEVGAYQNEVRPLMSMAFTQTKHNLHEFSDPVIMKNAYEAAYRFLFVNAMAEVLATNFTTTTRDSPGRRQVEIEAVLLEPVFVYLVEGFLGAVSICALILLYMSLPGRDKGKLRSDPGAISSVMSLVSDDKALLLSFADLDCCSESHLEHELRNRRFRMTGDGPHARIIESDASFNPPRKAGIGKHNSETATIEIGTPVRPVEFRLFMAIPVATLFPALLIALAALFAKSRPYGLPLPSDSKLAQNIVRQYLPTAIATFIEPLWVLVNRLYCMLQPLEELQRSKAATSRSIDLNYSSLPPQLTMFKALRARHLMLASVCGMALLANLLATSFAGLLFQDTLHMANSVSFSPPFEPKFMTMNSSTGPPVDYWNTGDKTLKYRGTSRRSTGEDVFLAINSNYTRKTLLPSWTDAKAMYLPFISTDALKHSGSARFQATTKYFRAEPNCRPLVSGDDYQLGMTKRSDEPGTVAVFETTVQNDAGRNVTCYPDYASGWHRKFGNAFQCSSGTVPTLGSKGSIEIVLTLEAGPNATRIEQETCYSTVAIGWMRVDNCTRGFERPDAQNTLLMSCRPKLSVGNASVIVDSAGVLQQEATQLVAEAGQSSQALDKYYTNGASELIRKSNDFLFAADLGPSYHNDAFSDGLIHYFMNKAAGNLELTDPNKPLPRFSDVEGPMKVAYEGLFAAWLGLNRQYLFVASNTTMPVSGTTVTRQERIFVHPVMFVISAVILGIYTMVSLVIILRRPGRYLARMPTSIAAVIALFATSAAVEDLQGTSGLSNKERARHLEKLGNTYGYGSYVGKDGSVHVGIEKDPFVRRIKVTSFEHTLAGKSAQNTFGVMEKKAGTSVRYRAVAAGEDV